MLRAVLLMLVMTTSVAAAGPKKVAAPKKPAKAAATYVALADVVDLTKTEGATAQGLEALKAELTKWKLTHARPGETPAEAEKAIAAAKTTGVELALTLKKGDADSLDASIIVSTWPRRVLVSEFRAGGSGGSVLELTPPIVAQLVADVAKDLGWAPLSPDAGR